METEAQPQKPPTSAIKKPPCPPKPIKPSKQKRVERDAWVHVKLTLEERKIWQEQAKMSGVTLSNLLRERMVTQQNDTTPRPAKRATRRADPQLIQSLGRVGSNLNQIARWANTYKTGADAFQIISALMAIDEFLTSRLPSFSSYRPTDATKPLLAVVVPDFYNQEQHHGPDQTI